MKWHDLIVEALLPPWAWSDEHKRGYLRLHSVTDAFVRCGHCKNLFRAETEHFCSGMDGIKISLGFPTKGMVPLSPTKTPPAASEQPKPVVTNKSRVVLDRVIADLTARGTEGEKKYGSKLMTNNGRDALMDAYQESLDLCQYLCQKIMEQEDGIQEGK